MLLPLLNDYPSEEHVKSTGIELALKGMESTSDTLLHVLRIRQFD